MKKTKNNEAWPWDGDTVAGDILIVDDNSDSLRLLSAMLAGAGYKVRPAPSGELALQALETKRENQAYSRPFYQRSC